jgi:hypothetical protein
MRRHTLLTVCLWFGAACPASAVDLAKIDRRIGKEPAYQAKPQYCLLVFGPEAGFRVWLVLDGDVLYVDRNGNGDLTEPDKRCSRSQQSTDLFRFENIKITDPSGSASYACGVYASPKVGHNNIIWVVGKLRQYSTDCFSERREEAPVLYFGGPLCMGLATDALLRGRGEAELRVHIGTRGWSKEGVQWVFVTYDNACVPPKGQPLVEIEYLSPSANGTVMKVTARLAQRC